VARGAGRLFRLTGPGCEVAAMSIEERVRRFVRENFFVGEEEPLAAETSLIASGIVDSTGMLEMIAFLESEFKIRVQDNETVPENLETIGRIASFVGRKLPSAA
jgi:acyl carrier protein